MLASAITPDGQTVIGYRTNVSLPRIDEIFLWTEASGFSDVGVYAPVLNTRMTGVSADAQTMVGWGGTILVSNALIWRSGQGFEPLADVATSELGLDLAGWTLVRANSITPDGNAIAGDGINPQGVEQGFVLYFDAPASGAPRVPVLGLLGLGGLTFSSLLLGNVCLRRRAV